jgi:hypothetical protein
MNAFSKIIAAALFAIASFCASAQTAPAPSTEVTPVVATPSSASLDLPKELKGNWYGWGRAGRVSRSMAVRFLDTTNLNDIKGTLSFEDKDCAAFVVHSPIEHFKLVDGLLYIDTPAPEECIKAESHPGAIGTRVSFTARMEKNAATWTAKGKGSLKSPTKVWQNFEVQMTSP